MLDVPRRPGSFGLPDVHRTEVVKLDYAKALATQALLPPELETALALCLREAVTNVHRHARARRVQVSLVADGGLCRLQVEDDGRGGTIRAGNGLSGMRERLRMLDGQLRLEPVHPRGTRLVAELPLPCLPGSGNLPPMPATPLPR